MPADVQTLVRQIAELSPEDLQILRRQLDSMAHQAPESELSRKLRERGLVRTPRAPRDPADVSETLPASITGEPVSEILIRERR